MRRLVGRLARLEQYSRTEDTWGNRAEAWAAIVRRYDTAHEGCLTEGEGAEGAATLAASGPPPSLTELARV